MRLPPGKFSPVGYAVQISGDHPQAILLLEEAIAIFRRITDPWNEGIVLHGQGVSFFQLELVEASMAAIWLARDLTRASGNPQAQQFGELFEKFERLTQSDEQAKTFLLALPNQAESIRQQAVTAIRKSLESQTESSEKE